MKAELKITGDVQRMTLGPNDHVLVKMDRPIHPDARREIQRELKELLNTDKPIIVYGPGMSISVVAQSPLDSMQF